ncbi:MAG: adenosylcobinamide-phosphate synthase CbiB [Proteobacteria bacterium]|nr:adenosylcobinamide-phosphate synthase CbiB [Pseudomonadota bacterium]
MTSAAVMALALGIDAALGWPSALYARLRHPVVWLGALIDALEARLNRPERSVGLRRAGGVVLVVIVVGLASLVGVLLTRLAPEGWPGVILLGVLGWPLIAARSLHDHVKAVADPLVVGDLAGARHAVSMIVGRDPNQLDAAGVARAAIESLAENTSDGVTAPLFWGAVLGLPGLFAYKAINTLDSMVGHRTPRFEAFGWASARLDDLVNLIPARLTGVLFALVAGRLRSGCTAMLRDAPKHRSPNAGWPEAAMADAVGVRLSGPRAYEGRVAEEPYVNAQGREAGAEDIVAALALYRRAMVAVWWLLVVISVAGGAA